MNTDQIAEAVYELLLVGAWMHHEVQDLDELEASTQISKHSYYLMSGGLPERPEVVRSITTGWGKEIHGALIADARSIAEGASRQLATSVISAMPSPESPRVQVTAFCKDKYVAVNFPVAFTDHRFTFNPPLESSQAEIRRISGEFARAVTARKKFLGLF